MELNAKDIENVVRDCLFREEELTPEHVAPEGAVIVEGITGSFGFHPGRLESARETVRAWLDELPDEFKLSGGGGWSFLNGCMDKHGSQWTGSQHHVELLFVLGIGLKLARYCLPRDVWDALPGGMPFITVL